jgi:hypothetical protein
MTAILASDLVRRIRANRITVLNWALNSGRGGFPFAIGTTMDLS